MLPDLHEILAAQAEPSPGDITPSPGLAGPERKAHRLPAAQDWRDQVCFAFADQGLEREAAEFSLCGDPSLIRYYRICENEIDHKPRKVGFTCHNRVCVECARRESARLAAKYTPTAIWLQGQNSPIYRLRHIILTTDISIHDPRIDQVYDNLFKQVKKLFYQTVGRHWERDGRAYLASIDFGETGEKLHVHVLAYCEYIPQLKLSLAWKALTGCPVVYIKAVYSVKKAVKEIVKYATKLTAQAPATVVKIYQLIKGSKRVRSYGLFYKVPKLEKKQACCSICGGNLIKVFPDEFKKRWAGRRLSSDSGDRDSLNSIIGNNSDKPPDQMEKIRAIQELNAWIAEWNRGVDQDRALRNKGDPKPKGVIVSIKTESLIS